jgi:hypothetical protein
MRKMSSPDRDLFESVIRHEKGVTLDESATLERWDAASTAAAVETGFPFVIRGLQWAW